MIASAITEDCERLNSLPLTETAVNLHEPLEIPEMLAPYFTGDRIIIIIIN